MEPKFGLVRVSDMENLPYGLLRVRSRWRSRARLAFWPADVEVQPPEPKIRSPSRPTLDALPLSSAIKQSVSKQSIVFSNRLARCRRSDVRRVVQECVITFSSWWSPYP